MPFCPQPVPCTLRRPGGCPCWGLSGGKTTLGEKQGEDSRGVHPPPPRQPRKRRAMAQQNSKRSSTRRTHCTAAVAMQVTGVHGSGRVRSHGGSAQQGGARCHTNSGFIRLAASVASACGASAAPRPHLQNRSGSAAGLGLKARPCPPHLATRGAGQAGRRRAHGPVGLRTRAQGDVGGRARSPLARQGKGGENRRGALGGALTAFARGASPAE